MKEYESGKSVYRQTVKGAKIEALITSIIMMIIAVGIEVLYLVIKSDWRYLPMVFGIFTFFFAIVEFFVNLVKIKRSSCAYCSIMYNFDEDIKYEFIEETYKPGDTRSYVVVEFTCYCPHCGDKETFRHNFLRASFDKEKEKWRYDDDKLEDKIRDYFYNL